MSEIRIADHQTFTRITRIVRPTRTEDSENELPQILDELRRTHRTTTAAAHRRRLADDLEFRFETGMRRKEVARLKVKQYFPKEKVLRDVIRWKTGTVTKFFPLSRRAAEIVENRLKVNADSEYIFTSNGEPVESDYRTLKNVCNALGIIYGRYNDGGFVPHDLRHNFASEIIRHTDIETAKNLTGHTGNEIFTYLHTDERKMAAAVAKREGRELVKQLIEVYKDVRRGKIKARRFVEIVRKIGEF